MMSNIEDISCFLSQQSQTKCVSQVIMPLLTIVIGSRAKTSSHVNPTRESERERNPSITHKHSPLHHFKSSLCTYSKVGYKEGTNWHVTKPARLVSMTIPEAGNSPGNSGGFPEAMVERCNSLLI